MSHERIAHNTTSAADAVNKTDVMNETEAAKMRMEDAVYGGSIHGEDCPSSSTKTNKAKKKNGFAVIVATGLICSIVGGSIGGAVGANIVRSQYESMGYVEQSTDGEKQSVQLIGNQNEISPVIAIA